MTKPLACYALDPVQVTINGHDFQVLPIIEVLPEHTTPDWDLTPDEVAAFECGDWDYVCIAVKVALDNMVGTDYLGGCTLRSNVWEQDVRDTVATHDMVSNACRELEQQGERILALLTGGDRG